MYSFGRWWKLKISLMGLVYRVVWDLKALWFLLLSETINFLRKLHKANISGCPRKFYHRVMYIAPSSGHISLNCNMPFKLIQGGLRLFSDVWSENAALFERLMEIHSNPPILYYGFNDKTFVSCVYEWKCHLKVKVLHWVHFTIFSAMSFCNSFLYKYLVSWLAADDYCT